MNITEPKHHKILSRTNLRNRGKSVIRYVLRYNPLMFQDAVCQGLDTELFYPDKEIFSPEEEKLIRRMCVECPVMDGCLEWALAHERYGIWAGTTPLQRRAMRKQIGWELSEPKMS